jgi:hypothetical protein
MNTKQDGKQEVKQDGGQEVIRMRDGHDGRVTATQQEHSNALESPEQDHRIPKESLKNPSGIPQESLKKPARGKGSGRGSNNRGKKKWGVPIKKGSNRPPADCFVPPWGERKPTDLELFDYVFRTKRARGEGPDIQWLRRWWEKDPKGFWEKLQQLKAGKVAAVESGSEHIKVIIKRLLAAAAGKGEEDGEREDRTMRKQVEGAES